MCSVHAWDGCGQMHSTFALDETHFYHRCFPIEATMHDPVPCPKMTLLSLWFRFTFHCYKEACVAPYTNVASSGYDILHPFCIIRYENKKKLVACVEELDIPLISTHSCAAWTWGVWQIWAPGAPLLTYHGSCLHPFFSWHAVGLSIKNQTPGMGFMLT